MPADNVTEGSETLPIRVALATEIQLGLISNTKKEIVVGAVHGEPRHRYRAVGMHEAGDGGSLERDWWKGIGNALRIDARLDHFNTYLVIGLIIGFYRSMETTAVIKPTIDIPQKIGRSRRRMCGIDGKHHVADFRLEEHLYGADRG